MLFEAYGQFSVFLAFIWLGLGVTVTYDIFHFHKRLQKVCFDFVYCLLCGILFIYFMHFYNLGQFRAFLCIGFVVGILVEKIFFSKTLESFRKLLYNYFINILTKVKNNYINTLSVIVKKSKPTKKNGKQRVKKLKHSNKLQNNFVNLK